MIYFVGSSSLASHDQGVKMKKWPKLEIHLFIYYFIKKAVAEVDHGDSDTHMVTRSDL